METLALTLGGYGLAKVLSQPATLSSTARWTRAYEAMVRKPSAITVAGFQAASRNLSATMADKTGINVAADDLLKAVSTPAHAGEDRP